MQIDRRTQIIDTSVRLFLQNGYSATGLSKIIEESGAPKGSLYYFFPNGKEEIALACIDKINKDVSAAIEHELSSAPFEEGVVNFIRNTGKFFESCKFQRLSPACFWISVETSKISSPLQQACMNVYDTWRAIYARHLTMIDIPSEKAKRIADIIVTLIEGSLVQVIVSQSATPLENIVLYIKMILSYEIGNRAK